MALIERLDDLAPHPLGLGTGLEERRHARRRQSAEVLRKHGPIHHHHAAVDGIVIRHGRDAERMRTARQVECDGVAGMHTVAVREGFGYDHRLCTDRGAQGGAPVFRFLEQQGAVVDDHLIVARTEHDEVVAVDEVDVAERVIRRHVGMGRDSGLHLGREGLL